MYIMCRILFGAIAYVIAWLTDTPNCLAYLVNIYIYIYIYTYIYIYIYIYVYIYIYIYICIHILHRFYDLSLLSTSNIIIININNIIIITDEFAL